MLWPSYQPLAYNQSYLDLPASHLLLSESRLHLPTNHLLHHHEWFYFPTVKHLNYVSLRSWDAGEVHHNIRLEDHRGAGPKSARRNRSLQNQEQNNSEPCQDSNLGSSDPHSDALSFAPQGSLYINIYHSENGNKRAFSWAYTHIFRGIPLEMCVSVRKSA